MPIRACRSIRRPASPSASAASASRLRDLVSVYAAIAHGGVPVTPARRHHAARLPPQIAAPVLDPISAWYVADILADVPPPLNGSPGRIAYKTGTSYGYRDGWAIGFDGKTVIGVWVGRPDGAPVPGPLGHRRRRADPVRGLRPPRRPPGAAAAGAAGRAPRLQHRTADAAAPLPPPR